MAISGADNIQRSLKQTDVWTAYFPLIFLTCGVVVIRDRMPAWAFMWALAIVIYASLKWASWWRSPVRAETTAARSIGYLLTWPGMDADSFLATRRRVSASHPSEWAWAIGKTVLGAILLWGIARRIPSEWPLLQAWVALVGMVLLAHFGSFHVVALLWRRAGVDPVPIMDRPLLSASLSEFWGRRWNLGFRQLGHEWIFRPLHREIGVAAAGFLVFVLSGLIHDLVISLPARGGYGLPTGYFVLQGAGVSLERSQFGRSLGLRGGVNGWVFMALLTAAPAFWLFHPPFLRNVVLPFMRVIHAI
jgi:alginate O-acetyltransferase complex protein AlgI